MDAARALAREAQFARLAACALRWLAACTAGFAGLLALSVLLASFERGAAIDAPEVSASAYLDLDLSVLRAIADRSLSADAPALHAMWARRPDWRLPSSEAGPVRLVPLREAWAAAAADRSRFRTAARGVGDALPFLAGGLSLAFLAAALAGMARQRRLFLPAAALLIALPAWTLLDAALFYDRTRSLGLGLSALAFVAAFAGALPGAASRALFSIAPQPAHLSALAGKPALGTAARLAALDAAEWLVPMVPALAAAALFVCAKADQDPALHADASGLGALVRAALGEASMRDRVSSCALIGGALVLLWFLGHRLVLEVRAALRVTA